MVSFTFVCDHCDGKSRVFSKLSVLRTAIAITPSNLDLMPKLGKCVSQFVEDSSTIYLKIDWHSVFLQTGASFSRQPHCKSLAEGTVCLQYNHEIMKIYFFAVGDSGSFIRLFVALLQIGKMGLKPSPQQPTQRYYLQLLSSCKESLGK